MSVKQIALFATVVIVGGVGYYLISPLFHVVERNDASPINNSTPTIVTTPTPGAQQPTSPSVTDSLDTMDEKTKAEMELQIRAMENTVVVKSERMPKTTTIQIMAQGDFQRRAHDVKGKAFLIENNGETTLRFENFETINGPDVRIYLSNGLSIDGAIDLGEMLATKGNVNYKVSTTVDPSKYSYVLVWCRAFNVLFSYAQLQ